MFFSSSFVHIRSIGGQDIGITGDPHEHGSLWVRKWDRDLADDPLKQTDRRTSARSCIRSGSGPDSMSEKSKSPTKAVKNASGGVQNAGDQDTENKPAAVLETNRKRLRVNCNIQNVVVCLVQADNRVAKHSVVTRNLSGQGLSFIHGQFIHVGSECMVELPTLEGSVNKMPGRIARCGHVMGILHQVAVVFDKPIKLEKYVRLTPAQLRQVREEEKAQKEQERNASIELRGRVLVIEAIPNDRKLTEFGLEKIGLEIERGDGGDPFAAAKQSGADIVLIDVDNGEKAGAGTITALRDAGYDGLIVAQSAEDDESIRSEAQETGAAFLVKPYDLDTLRMTLQQLFADNAVDPSDHLRSDLIDDEQMKPLIVDYVQALGEQLGRLQEACQADDVVTMRKVCRHLKGSGASYGFGPISEVTTLAMSALAEEQQDIQAIKKTVGELIAMARKAVAD